MGTCLTRHDDQNKEQNERTGEGESRGNAADASDDSASTSVKQKQKDRRLTTIHAELVQYLAKQMTPDMVKEFKDNLLTREVISPHASPKLATVHEIIAHLQSRNEIVIGNKDGYMLLIEILKGMEQEALAKMVEQCQDDLSTICSDESATTDEQSTKKQFDEFHEASYEKKVEEKRLSNVEGSLSQILKELGRVREQLQEELPLGQNVDTIINEQSIEIMTALSKMQGDIDIIAAKNKDDIETAKNEVIKKQEAELADLTKKVQELSKQLDEKDARLKKAKEQLTELTQQLEEAVNKNKQRELELENTYITPYAHILLKGKEKEIGMLEKQLQEQKGKRHSRTVPIRYRRHQPQERSGRPKSGYEYSQSSQSPHEEGSSSPEHSLSMQPSPSDSCLKNLEYLPQHGIKS